MNKVNKFINFIKSNGRYKGLSIFGRFLDILPLLIGHILFLIFWGISFLVGFLNRLVFVPKEPSKYLTPLTFKQSYFYYLWYKDSGNIEQNEPLREILTIVSCIISVGICVVVVYL